MAYSAWELHLNYAEHNFSHATRKRNLPAAQSVRGHGTYAKAHLLLYCTRTTPRVKARHYIQ